MNIANKITIFRIILVPLLLIVGMINPPGEFLGISITFWIMIIIFIIASISDKIDGYLARHKNMITTFGQFLDPIADKILVLTVMMFFVKFGKMPVWIPFIILFREFLVSGIRLVAAKTNGDVIQASVLGKIKTVTEMIGIILMFIDVNSYGEFITGSVSGAWPLFINIASFTFITISVIMAVISGVNYIYKEKDLLK